MHRRLVLLSLSATALAAAGCAATPEVRHDRDAAADWAGFKTYAIEDTARLGRTGYTTLHEARLAQAAQRELEKSGLVRAPLAVADLRVHLLLKVNRQQQLHASPAGHGAYRGFGGWGGTRIDVSDVRQGALIVDLVDARRNALVWRGVAEGAVADADARDPGAAIDRAMADVFAGFRRL